MKRIFCRTLLCIAWFSAISVHAGNESTNPPVDKSASTEGRNQLELEYMKKGEGHFFAHRSGAALQWFRLALEINPDNAAAHAYTGDILFSLGEADQALKHFRVAAELTSNPSKEYFRIGQIHYLRGDRSKAEHYFHQALKADPQLAEAHFYLGLLSYRMGRNRENTLAHLKAFRAARPEFSDIAALDRAIALLEDPATKLDGTKDLIEVDPLHLFFRKKQTDPDRNRKSETPTETTPKNSDTNSIEPTMNDAAKDLTETEEKVPPPDHFLSISSGPGSAMNRALVYRSEDPARALSIVKQALKQNEKDASLHSLKCEILFRMKNATGAQDRINDTLTSCTRAAELSPDYRNLQNLGRVQEAAKNMPGAYNSYVQALDRRMDTDLAVHAVRIGDTLAGKKQETRAILERLLARRPDHREGLLLMLQRQQQEKNRIGLRATSERLRSLYPDDIDVLREMASILLSDPDTEDEAVAVLQQYHDRNPEDLRAGLSLAGIHLRRGAEKEALLLLGALYESHPENYDVVRAILILFVRSNRNLDSAEKVARRFLDSGPPSEQRAAIMEILPEDLRVKIQPPLQKDPEKSPDSDQQVPRNTPVQP